MSLPGIPAAPAVVAALILKLWEAWCVLSRPQTCRRVHKLLVRAVQVRLHPLANWKIVGFKRDIGSREKTSGDQNLVALPAY